MTATLRISGLSASRGERTLFSDLDLTVAGQIELEGSERPAVVVEAVYRFFE